MSTYKIIQRYSYGSKYNNILIDKSNNTIKKVCYNNEGYKKIVSEIALLKYIIDNNIKFPIPKIYNFDKYEYTMEYLDSYRPLYEIFNKLSNDKKYNILNKIYKLLEELHNYNKLLITKEKYLEDLNIEIYEKINERFNKIKSLTDKYNFIKTINNIPFIQFNDLLELICEKILLFFNSKNEYYYTIIHGDCQFNNILYNEQTNDIKFIDPRGYYANNILYGIPEYDTAKVKFALSGYDQFDNSVINNLDINDNNINIDINILDNTIFDNSLETLLMLNIWLGNAHSFIDNEYKMIYSYFIALYYGSLYISKNNNNNIYREYIRLSNS
jgi:hypothetical protein